MYGTTAGRKTLTIIAEKSHDINALTYAEIKKKASPQARILVQ